MAILRGFHGNSVIHVGENFTQIKDLKEGDEVSTGCEKQPKALVRKVYCEEGSGKLVTLRPGLSVVDTHPVKTHGGLNEGVWQRAQDIKKPSVERNGKWYNIELSGHIDTILVSGVICSVIGTYCGPRIGWDEFTRKNTRCTFDEMRNASDEFDNSRRRCVICDIVCGDRTHDPFRKSTLGPVAAVPRALREEAGHACFGEQITQQARL